MRWRTEADVVEWSILTLPWRYEFYCKITVPSGDKCKVLDRSPGLLIRGSIPIKASN